MGIADEQDKRRIDDALQGWRQGDCVVGEQWFLFRLDPRVPLTTAATAAADLDTDTGEERVEGLMILTQTCDIGRHCGERPFLEACPLVAVDAARIREIRRGRRPAYAFVPGVAHLALVADLDRAMTVEKAVAARWNRVPGCLNDRDSRQLSLALARKRARTAFPDDFVRLASPLLRRISSKHNKASDEGRALRALDEIRVRAAPAWDADQVSLTFWFIRDETRPGFEESSWDQWLSAWLERLPETGRFRPIDGVISTLDDLTARDYVESDRLDLDYLSGGGKTS